MLTNYKDNVMSSAIKEKRDPFGSDGCPKGLDIRGFAGICVFDPNINCVSHKDCSGGEGRCCSNGGCNKVCIYMH